MPKAAAFTAAGLAGVVLQAMPEATEAARAQVAQAMAMAGQQNAMAQQMGPSGTMFLCALLVATQVSHTSNIGDKGQDIITMTSEAACLPLYLLETEMGRRDRGFAVPRQPARYPGGYPFPGGVAKKAAPKRARISLG